MNWASGIQCEQAGKYKANSNRKLLQFNCLRISWRAGLKVLILTDAGAVHIEARSIKTTVVEEMTSSDNREVRSYKTAEIMEEIK